MQFEFSRWDGTDNFSPQSADALFDQLAEYFLHHGEEVLDALPDWEKDHPDLMDKLIKRGYIEKDKTGQYRVTPRGLKRVGNQALEQLIQISNRDAPGRHETEFRGAGQVTLDESKPYEFGDPVSNLNLHETLK
ncbi:MAG TPA: VWA domain-containing protein, partial [Planctomicrobium sp.]|nr:VWA domain-containing protein [Planctomicrobium sp.]